MVKGSSPNLMAANMVRKRTKAVDKEPIVANIAHVSRCVMSNQVCNTYSKMRSQSVVVSIIIIALSMILQRGFWIS